MSAHTTEQRAVGYIRVSTVGGRGGDSFLSPDLQRDRIRAWADYRQRPVISWYTDLDVSGRAGVYRPEFERMMLAAAEGEFETVAVYRLTRFGRSSKECAVRLDELLAHGVDLVSVTEDLDTSTPGGRFMRSTLFAMAQFESERIGEEWSGVHKARRRKGLAHASRGVYGYEVKGAVPVRPDEAEAAAIRGAYHRRAEGHSLYSIRLWLHEQGHRPRSGADYFAASTVGRLLRSPIYAGMVETQDGLLDASHPAIVPRSLWDRVQAMHAAGGVGTRHRSGLLAGLVVCASCGHRMQAHHLRGVAHYRCQGESKFSDRCERPTMIAQHKLDQWAEGEVLKLLDPRLLPRGGRLRAGGDARRQRRLTAAERRVVDITRALDRLADERYLLGSLDPAEYERQAGRLLEDRAGAEVAASELREASARSQPVVQLDAALWERMNLDQRQRLVRTIIHQVAVRPIPKAGARWVKAGDRAVIEWL